MAPGAAVLHEVRHARRELQATLGPGDARRAAPAGIGVVDQVAVRRYAAIEVPALGEPLGVPRGQRIAAAEPHALHGGGDARVRRARKPGMQAQPIGQRLGAEVAHLHALVQPARHQAEALHAFVVIGVALEAVRVQRHLQGVRRRLAQAPGLQPAVAVDGVRLARAVGFHRMKAPRMEEPAAADAVGPGHHGERGHAVEVGGAAVPGTPQVGAAPVRSVDLPGRHAAAQRRHEAQVLAGMVQPGDRVKGFVHGRLQEVSRRSGGPAVRGRPRRRRRAIRPGARPPAGHPTGPCGPR